MEKLNEFSKGMAYMKKAGWIFSGKNGPWRGSTQYRPNIHNIIQKGQPYPSDKAYWGWDYPGNGVIRLRLHGTGEVTLDLGNAYFMGHVVVKMIIPGMPCKVLSRIGPNDRHAIVKGHFEDGWMITITEKSPRAIIVLNSIKFNCPATGPTDVGTPAGQLVDQRGIDQFVSGAKWNIVDVSTQDQCSSKCVFSHFEAEKWGSSEAISSRTFCATECLYNEECTGFLYPDPGDDLGKGCKLYKPCQVEENLCKEDLPKYAAHAIVDKTPADYPELVKEIN
jgi:hypothetical protein